MRESAYTVFDRDVPEARREDVLTMICEEAHVDGTHDCVTILDRDQLNAVNVRVAGIIDIDGTEFTFQLESGDRNGTELLAWESDTAFEYHVPTRWALQPVRDLIGKALEEGKGPFLVAKWDAMLARAPIAEIPGKYSYDRHFQPGGKVETYWKAEAAEHHFEIVTQETADETRKTLVGAAS